MSEQIYKAEKYHHSLTCCERQLYTVLYVCFLFRTEGEGPESYGLCHNGIVTLSLKLVRVNIFRLKWLEQPNSTKEF